MTNGERDEPFHKPGNGVELKTPVGTARVSGVNGPLYLAVLVLAGALGVLIWVIVTALQDTSTNRDRLAASLMSSSREQHGEISKSIGELSDSMDRNTQAVNRLLCLRVLEGDKVELRRALMHRDRDGNPDVCAYVMGSSPAPPALSARPSDRLRPFEDERRDRR